MIAQPSAQPTGGSGQRVGIEQTPDGSLFGHELVGFFCTQALRPELLKGSQEGIGQDIVYPGGELRSAGRVGAVAMGTPPHRYVGAANDLHRGLYFWPGSKAGRGHIGRSPRQAPERVSPVGGVIRHTGHHLGMGCLNQQSPNPADEGSRVTDHRPGNRVRTEQTWVTPIRKSVFQWIGGMSEQAGGRTDHPLSEPIDNTLEHSHYGTAP